MTSSVGPGASRTDRNNIETRVVIGEINMAETHIEASDSTGGTYILSLDLLPPMVSIPVKGEIWTIRRRGNDWYLMSRIESGTEQVPITSLSPGDRRIEAETFYLDTRKVAINALDTINLTATAVIVNGVDINTTINNVLTSTVLLSPTTDTRNIIQPTTDSRPLAVKAKTGQTHVLFEALTDTNSSLFSIAANGNFVFGGDTSFYRPAVGYLQTDGALRSARSSSANPSFGAFINGDIVERFLVTAGGIVTFSGGTAGTNDTNLYRAAANQLKTDDLFLSGSSVYSQPTGAVDGFFYNPSAAGAYAFQSVIQGESNPRFRFDSSGQLFWGTGSAATDTNLYRTVVATQPFLKTDNQFASANNIFTTGMGATRVGFLDPGGASNPDTYFGMYYDAANTRGRISALSGGVAWRDVLIAENAALMTNQIKFGTSNANFDTTLTRTSAAALTMNGTLLSLAHRLETTNAIGPRIVWKTTDLGTNLKPWQMVAVGGSIYIGALNDAENAQTIALQINRTSGTTIDSVNIPNSQLQEQGVRVATLVSPTFTGTPAAPTAATGTNTTQLATTAFVRADSNELTKIGTSFTVAPRTGAKFTYSSGTEFLTFTFNGTNWISDPVWRGMLATNYFNTGATSEFGIPLHIPVIQTLLGAGVKIQYKWQGRGTHTSSNTGHSLTVWVRTYGYSVGTGSGSGDHVFISDVASAIWNGANSAVGYRETAWVDGPSDASAYDGFRICFVGTESAGVSSAVYEATLGIRFFK